MMQRSVMRMIEPKLRFPEFKDSWNNYKIENMFDRVGTPVDLDDAQTYREIGIRSHGKGIFHKEETTAIEIGNKRVFWVEPDCFVVNIVFAWERAVAKTTEKENGMIASHRFPMYKPKKDIVDLDYITEYFITKRGQNVLILASPGGAGRNKTLGQKEFAKSVVKLPLLPEQQKIADFLSTIDTVISNYNDTIKAWEDRKKGVMQKLFSQEVRFKADDGSEFPEWEEKKFANLYRKNVEKNVNLEFDSSKTISIASMQFNEKGNGASEDSLSSYKVLRLGDIAFEGHENKEYSHGRFVLNDIGDGIMSPRFSCMRPVCTQVDGFWKYYIHSERVMKNTLVRSTKKGTMMHELVIPDFLKQSIMVPSLAEQQKIADCLSSLDEVIKKQKATLAAWEEMKKGLLQQMFV